MKKISLSLLAAVIVLTNYACLDNIGAKPITETKKATDLSIIEEPFKYWTWITADPERTDESYTEEFKKYKQNGLDAILINTNADAKLLARLAPLAKKEGLELHAWIMAMNRPGDKEVNKHPEWYVVSRSGKSAYDNRPYVGYYEFLCPTRTESRNHVLKLVSELADVEDVASVHLDYIRYPDVYLPVGLLPKYDLKQETELPDYDFCYCDVCVETFEKEHGRNPREMENPAIDIEWKQFRLTKIRAVVNDAYDIVHKKNKILTAAVFPYPEMADHMVRQRWDKWNVDVVLPMIYNNFYNEPVEWVGFATKQGVQDLAAKNTQLHTGIYVPEMSGEDVAKAIQLAKDNGAKGVAIFDGPAITEDHFKAIRESKK